ncbi:MAG: response regulator [Limisphaerales bacterium]
MSAAKRIRTLVVDDHHVVRLGLRGIQEIDRKIEIVGDAGTAAEALTAVEKKRPDVILLDVRLPDRSGLEICREIKTIRPDAKVLVLTSYADDNWALAAMDAGADGYLLKDNDAHKIIEAIHSVMNGGASFDPTITRALVERVRNGGPKNPLGELSELEMRVLAEVAEGKTDKEAAQVLDLQPKTVRNYLDRTFKKLGVNTRTQATLVYIRNRSQV